MNLRFIFNIRLIFKKSSRFFIIFINFQIHLYSCNRFINICPNNFVINCKAFVCNDGSALSSSSPDKVGQVRTDLVHSPVAAQATKTRCGGVVST